MVINVVNYSDGDEYARQLDERLPPILKSEYGDWNNFLGSYNHRNGNSEADGKAIAGRMFEDISFTNAQLMELAGEFHKTVPVATDDHSYYNRLEGIVLKPVSEILRKKVPIELTPKQYAKIANLIVRQFLYRYYQEGRSILSYKGVVDGLNKAISSFRLVSQRFLYRWEGHFRCRGGIVGKKDSSVLVFYGVLSESGGKILLDAIETQNPRLFHDRSPHYGIEKLILGDPESRQGSEESIEKIFLKNQVSRLALTAVLRQMGDKIKFGELMHRLYPPRSEQTREPRPRQDTYVA